MTARDRRTVRAAAWCHRRLLWLYPATFRVEYGAAMTQAFRDRCRAAAADQGLAALARAVVAGLADAAISGVLERASAGPDLAPARATLPAITVASRVSIAAGAAGRELRLAARRLVREPTFTLVVVATLAIGIGAATTIFSVVHGVLLQPLPYRDADRVVTLWQWNQPKGIDEAPSPANFLDWRDASRTLDLAAAEPFGVDLTGSGDPIGLETWRVSERFFDVLGVTPALGRVFLPEEHQTGRDYVALLSDRLWRTRFGGDPGIVGQTITLDGKAVVVAGVLPATVDYPEAKDIWIPRVFTARDRQSRGQTYYQVIGRLKPGVTIAQARDDMRGIGDRLAAAYPRVNKGVEHHRRSAVRTRHRAGAQPAAAPARGRGMRHVHRQRERRQPDAGARGGAPGGDCRAPRARCRPSATAAADGRRERAPDLCRRRRRRRRRRTGPSPASSLSRRATCRGSTRSD